MIVKNLFVMTNKKLAPLFIVGAFIVLNFIDNVTKFKNLIIILMAIIAIYHLVKDTKNVIKPLKNTLFYGIILFIVAMLYSILISVNPEISIDSLNKPVFNGLLLFSILTPLVLYKASSTQIAKMILISFSLSLCAIFLKDIFLYISNYKQNIMPFTELSHRDLANDYIFCFPVILCLWHLYKRNSVSHWIVFLAISAVTVVLMLGTFARAAWLAALIMSLIIITLNKEKTLALICVAALGVGAALLLSYDNAQDHPLTRKMEQTSSSGRYEGGTQGTALELILQNPVKGYGYGNEIFHQLYNSQVEDHPEWIYKKSLGPHNVYLALWFAAGIPGLLAAIALAIAALNYSVRMYISSKDNAFANQAMLLLMTSFISWYIVRGSFENVHLQAVGILIGLMLALGFSIKQEKMSALQN